MSANELARMRDEYDRQTAAWEQLKERFASLASAEIRVSPGLLERLGVPAAPVAPMPPVCAGIPARGFRA
jgi:hypothetical protein